MAKKKLDSKKLREDVKSARKEIPKAHIPKTTDEITSNLAKSDIYRKKANNYDPFEDERSPYIQEEDGIGNYRMENLENSYNVLSNSLKGIENLKKSNKISDSAAEKYLNSIQKRLKRVTKEARISFEDQNPDNIQWAKDNLGLLEAELEQGKMDYKTEQSAKEELGRKYKILDKSQDKANLLKNCSALNKKLDSMKLEDHFDYWASILTIGGFTLALLFFSPTLTGNAIANLTTKTSSIIGAGLFVVGIVGSYFYFKKK
jgi:hypothetical protein